MFRDIIELISFTITQDEIGQDIETPTYTEVYAEKNSVPRIEFFEAGAKGIKPACMFKVREIDYADQEKLRYNSKIYTIYRTYSAKSEMIELYCEIRVGE